MSEEYTAGLGKGFIWQPGFSYNQLGLYENSNPSGQDSGSLELKFVNLGRTWRGILAGAA